MTNKKLKTVWDALKEVTATYKEANEALQMLSEALRSIEDETTYCIGQTFELARVPYLLCYCGTSDIASVHLVNLSGGGQWCEPVKVENEFKITTDEMYLIAGHRRGYKLIK